ncbi:OmpH family outer membrane protein [Leptobacterium flavescens]|uniref:OmpH family outer membrane protein n=1 Tax=Leptobacterium flavescens TaxID=472055 RepID=A0A6P0UH39_9FLAO|nr:OmpH family outer membrane protein [Leptobacterium flavescens]NER12575.1 OmpH family outer membrane protein [Leptobacterium flavescens]
MKQIKTFVIAFALVVGATSYVNAQSKIAHINVQQLVNDMPETKAARAEISKLEQTYRTDLENSGKELQNKFKQYQNEAQSKTKEENEKRAQEVQQLELNIRQAEQAAAQELQKKQLELLEPIFNKAREAIQKVARAQGFQYVLDTTQGSGVILADGKDLMADVKKELGF